MPVTYPDAGRRWREFLAACESLDAPTRAEFKHVHERPFETFLEGLHNITASAQQTLMVLVSTTGTWSGSELARVIGDPPAVISRRLSAPLEKMNRVLNDEPLDGEALAAAANWLWRNCFGEVAPSKGAYLVPDVATDIQDGKLGIERLWATRRDWRRDPRDGMKTLIQEWLPNAGTIQILANTFSRRWLGDPEFFAAFQSALLDNDSANCEIVLYHPESAVLALRAFDEGDDRDAHSMAEEIVESLKILRELHGRILDMGHLRVWLTFRMEHLHHVFRIDDRMVVFFYMHGLSGGPSPAMLLSRPSKMFEAFANEFAVVRERALPVRFSQSALPTLPDVARATTLAPFPWKD